MVSMIEVVIEMVEYSADEWAAASAMAGSIAAPVDAATAAAIAF